MLVVFGIADRDEIAAAVLRECRLQVCGKRWACWRLRSNRIVLWIASRGAPPGPNMIATMLLVGTKRSSAGIALMMACSVSRLMKDCSWCSPFGEVMSAPVGVPPWGPAGWRRQLRRAAASEGEFQRGSAC